MSPYDTAKLNETEKRSSDRNFGFIVGGILLLIAAVRIYFRGFGNLDIVTIVLLLIAIPLIVLALVAPHTLRHANAAWMKLGELLARIVNPIVLGLIFLVTVVPIGLGMRVLGKRPLSLKRDPEAETYWIEKDPPGPTPESMKEQF